MEIRPPYVAGHFYPADTNVLGSMVDEMLAGVAPSKELSPPKAIIAPHAGYIYSGCVAASIYSTVIPIKDKISKVILLGPAHRVPFLGIAATEVDYFATPLGQVPVDNAAITEALNLAQVNILEKAYFMEHCLEVHLPFLQTVLNDFKVAPFIVGSCEPTQVAELLDMMWGGDETLIVISSDLSHYHDYNTAKKMDLATSNAIASLNPDAMNNESACGRIPVKGLLLAAQQKGLTCNILDLRNSGDTAGDKERVVGYGAYHFV